MPSTSLTRRIRARFDAAFGLSENLGGSRHWVIPRANGQPSIHIYVSRQPNIGRDELTSVWVLDPFATDAARSLQRVCNTEEQAQGLLHDVQCRLRQNDDDGVANDFR